ncbi:putative rRNA-processing protein EBP2-like protein [Frankliniella fusca]|uniref:rRNA-processing protein EBP2-like protein n=1 Tax=Frankliniella fusca TaxID=407009 RepID=A0AAE1HDX1_9NEOP|nr:putative rRNA-processing protein EBP2-like protein [Frankliniella fusca]
MSDSSEYEDVGNEDMEYDSDAELQEAFAKGIIKPGLNVPVEPKKEYTNNVEGLKTRLRDILQSLKWVERLDLTTGLAPIAPEMAVYMAEKEDDSKTGKLKQAKSLDPTLDDFKREMNFHRQAQAAVLEGIPKLNSLGVKTKRPDDYFAQMAKSDEHMQKVRDSLLKKKAGLEVSEKVRKARENRKMMKQLQVQAQLNRQKEKKELMDEVKKYRKGIRTDLDFLEPGGGKKPAQQKRPAQNTNKNKRSAEKRKHKDSKYGFGGKKRGLKTNTKESAADVGGYLPPRKPGAKNRNMNKKNQNRPGKNKRNNIKSKRRK